MRDFLAMSVFYWQEGVKLYTVNLENFYWKGTLNNLNFLKAKLEGNLFSSVKNWLYSASNVFFILKRKLFVGSSMDERNDWPNIRIKRKKYFLRFLLYVQHQFNICCSFWCYYLVFSIWFCKFCHLPWQPAKIVQFFFL